MANFYVLTPPGATDPEKQTRFVRDGFSWAAFILPLPWLILRGLWLHAGLAVLLYIVALFAAETWGLDGLPLAYGVVLALWTAIEGGYARMQALQRRGWDVKAHIVAADIDEAEGVYFASLTPATPASVARPAGTALASRSPAPVALGLIGPYGGR